MQRWVKPFVFVLCLLPLVQITYGVTIGFKVNPVEYVLRELGGWALKFLLITLAVTPLRKFTGWAWIMPLRRMLGLYAFFYALLHLLVFFSADLAFSLSALWREALRHPYITAGLASFFILLPLAVTSTDKMIKRLGGVRWRKLHRLVYAAAILGVLHFYWMKASKANVTEPLIYAAILAALLLYRLADSYGFAPRLTRSRRG